VGPATEFAEGEPSEAQAAWGDVYGDEGAPAGEAAAGEASADDAPADDAGTAGPASADAAATEGGGAGDGATGLEDAEGAVETAVAADED